MKNALIEKMQNGGWLFAQLAPPFVEQITSNRGESPSSIFSIDVGKFYNAISVDFQVSDFLESSSGKVVFGESNDFHFKTILHSIKKKLCLSKKNSHDFVVRINECEKYFESLLPEIFYLYKKFIYAIAIVETSSFRGASHPHMYGTIFLSDSFLVNGPIEEVCTSIIHEMAHQELFLLNLVDRLIQKGSESSFVHAPYQGRPRPPIGRLHSCHALFRMLQAGDRKLRFREELMKKFNENIYGFLFEELTDYGKEIINKVYKPFLFRIHTVRGND